MANAKFDQSRIITIERHILEEQQIHPEATGALTNILYDLALAGNILLARPPELDYLKSWVLLRISISRVKQ
jgi:hypothetical protein